MRYDGMGSSSLGGSLLLIAALLALIFFGGMWILANTDKIAEWLSKVVSQLFSAAAVICGYLVAGAFVAFLIQIWQPSAFSDEGFYWASAFFALLVGWIVLEWRSRRKK